MFMHNGFISEFPKIKRKLQSLIRDEIFHHVQGNTDSEWAFALFLNHLKDPLQTTFHYSELRDALLNTIAVINNLSSTAGVENHSLLNFAVSDGENVVCTRYCNDIHHHPASLFYSFGTSFEFKEDKSSYKMIKQDNRTCIAIIASEPLTFERNDWNSVPANTMIVITNRMNIKLYKIPDNHHVFHNSKVEITG
jgi:glutamine amidotransferase